LIFTGDSRAYKRGVLLFHSAVMLSHADDFV
jgi:hypothetical protein